MLTRRHRLFRADGNSLVEVEIDRSIGLGQLLRHWTVDRASAQLEWNQDSRSRISLSPGHHLLLPDGKALWTPQPRSFVPQW